jgi:ABC-2 type transport system permease protein
MSCLFGTSMTGSNLLLEIQTGSHERMLVTPLRRPALLIGRALKEIVPVVAQAALIVAVCLPFGFELHLGGALLGVLLLSVFCLGLGALSYTLALAAKNQEWLFWTVQQTLLFPLLLLAGMLLPIEGGPGWLQTPLDAQPADVRRRRGTRTLQRRDPHVRHVHRSGVGGGGRRVRGTGGDARDEKVRLKAP